MFGMPIKLDKPETLRKDKDKAIAKKRVPERSGLFVKYFLLMPLLGSEAMIFFISISNPLSNIRKIKPIKER